MTEREKAPADGRRRRSRRRGDGTTTVQLIPIGSPADGSFDGRLIYPTTGAEVHAVASVEVDAMFHGFREKNFDIGRVSNHHPRASRSFPMFGRHCAILADWTGKSWSVASICRRPSSMPRAHIILLDLHGEYRRVSTGRAHCDDSVEIPYWLMIRELTIFSSIAGNERAQSDRLLPGNIE